MISRQSTDQEMAVKRLCLTGDDQQMMFTRWCFTDKYQEIINRLCLKDYAEQIMIRPPPWWSGGEGSSFQSLDSVKTACVMVK